MLLSSINIPLYLTCALVHTQKNPYSVLTVKKHNTLTLSKHLKPYRVPHGTCIAMPRYGTSDTLSTTPHSQQDHNLYPQQPVSGALASSSQHKVLAERHQSPAISKNYFKFTSHMARTAPESSSIPSSLSLPGRRQ